MNRAISKVIYWLSNLAYKNILFTKTRNANDIGEDVEVLTIAYHGKSRFKAFFALLRTIRGAKYWWNEAMVKPEGKAPNFNLPSTLIWRRLPTLQWKEDVQRWSVTSRIALV